MKLQQLLSQTRRAVDDYHMINAGDRIAVGISGGKDSLTMLYALNGLRRFYPLPFEIEAITVDLGFTGADEALKPIQGLCDEFGVHYTVVPSQIAEIIFDIRKEKNPCALCAKLRKGAFNDMARQLGCNKVAYAHHMDDIIETMFLSMFYEGQFYSFAPVTYLDRSGITVIRPLMYVPEANVIGFLHKYHLPLVKNPCPADGETKREYVKQLVRQINLENPGVKKRIFHAICTGRIEGWNINGKQ